MQSRCFSTGRRVLCGVVLFGSALLFSSRSNAQISGTGNIQGTVTDTTGAVIVDANVTLTNEATGVKSTSKTSTAGVFLFPGLRVGTYDLSVSAPNFKSYVQKGIVLEVGSSIAVNPTLSVVAASVKKQVQAEGL